MNDTTTKNLQKSLDLIELNPELVFVTMVGTAMELGYEGPKTCIESVLNFFDERNKRKLIELFGTDFTEEAA